MAHCQRGSVIVVTGLKQYELIACTTLSGLFTCIAVHSSVRRMDGWLVLWKIKIAMTVAPAIAVKIMPVLQNGFMLLALLLQETTILFCTPFQILGSAIATSRIPSVFHWLRSAASNRCRINSLANFESARSAYEY